MDDTPDTAPHAMQPDDSPELRALYKGFDDERARQSLRFSFDWSTRPEDGDQAAAIVIEAAEGLR